MARSGQVLTEAFAPTPLTLPAGDVNDRRDGERGDDWAHLDPGKPRAAASKLSIQMAVRSALSWKKDE